MRKKQRISLIRRLRRIIRRLRVERTKLQGLIKTLANRVEAQSELLTRKATRGTNGTPAQVDRREGVTW